MNIVRILVLGISLLIGIPVTATTLQLPETLELVIVDGVTVNSTLLRSADSLELAKGRHQLMFTFNENAFAGKGIADSARQVYVIAHFDTGDARRLHFQLPPLDSREDIENFLRQPALMLLDEHGAVVNATYRRLPDEDNAPLSRLRKPGIVYRPAQSSPFSSPGRLSGPSRPADILRGYFSLLFV